MSLSSVPNSNAAATGRLQTLASLVKAPAAAADAQPQVTVAKDGKSVTTPTDAEAETVNLDHALEQAVAQLADAKANLAKAQAQVQTAKPAAAATPATAIPAKAQPAKAATGDTHTVKAGDTLSKIAKQYAGDPKAFKELLTLNPHIKNPDKIFPGQTITMPATWKKAAAPATTTPAKVDGAAPAGAIDTSGVTGKADAEAMVATTAYIKQNFDKVAGPDGMISKEDLQKNLPDGPGKAEYLKQFDRLKFNSIDEGDAAWSNLTRKDIDETGRFLQSELGDKRLPDWEFFSKGVRIDDQKSKEFAALDKNSDGKLTGAEIPDSLKNDPGAADGIDRTEFDATYVPKDMFPLIDESDARLAAYEKEHGKPEWAPDPARPVLTAAEAAAIDTSGITDKADAEAMVATTAYIKQNFDKVAGPDGMISKEDLQKNLPDGPGKAEYLKQFDRLKFNSIDEGDAAWSNLTRKDIDETGRFLQSELGDRRLPDWEMFSTFTRDEAQKTKQFAALDKNADGKLTGEEVPTALKNAVGAADGLDRDEYAAAFAEKDTFPQLDLSARRIEAYEMKNGRATWAPRRGEATPAANATTAAANAPAKAAVANTPAAGTTTAKPAKAPVASGKPESEEVMHDRAEFSRLDYSGDGLINNDGGRPYRFNAKYDTNHDNAITEQEWLAGRAKDRQGKSADEVRAIQQDENDFARLDRSGDGLINNDGGKPYKDHAHYDANHDNEISIDEFKAGRAKERLNGRPGMSAAEARAVAKDEADFDALDLSGDGVINNDGGKPYKDNARFDTNHDNEISLDEFKAGRAKERKG